MKTKYAELINQLERVTEAYEVALAAVKALEATTSGQPDVLGVTGGVNYFGDDFEKNRAIQLGADTFTPVALGCGSDFSYESRGDKDYGLFRCTVFGYRVYALITKGTVREAYLLDLAVAEEKSNE